MQEVDTDGAFKRTEAQFRNFIKQDGSSEFPVESGRYHLFVSYACPWASRCLLVRSLKGLEDHITFDAVEPVFEKTSKTDDHVGWVFSEEYPDTVLGTKTIREIYEKSSDSVKKFTVPVLYDKVAKKIVSNESSEIIRMFNTEFNALAKNPDLDLYPKDIAKEIDQVNRWVYPQINNGVYRAGFAQSQKAYDIAVKDVFKGLDRAEAILSENRFLCGSRLTEADVRLFVTLIRFDDVYFHHFKCSLALIQKDYHNLFNYIKHIYQMPGVASTVNMDHIRNHYFRSHESINPFAIVPLSPAA